jgi:hypothetical protein
VVFECCKQGKHLPNKLWRKRKMRNSQVIAAFLDGKRAKTKHLSTDGNFLNNYSTVIAKWEHGGIKVNVKKYSQTTSTIQNALLRTAEGRGITVVKVEEEIHSLTIGD